MIASHQVTVGEDDANQRLDKYLSTALPHLSRARVQQLIEQTMVLSAGKPVTNASKKVKAGETYDVTEPEIVALDLTPAHIKLDIIYEDAHLLVINKAPGMTVHPAPGAGNQTLVHALLAHCGDSLSGIGGVARPGIVHRIDKDTSGLLVVAKTDTAHQSLSAQLKSRALKRIYLCYAWGAANPRIGTIDAPMGRNKLKRKMMAVVEDGKHAVTHYETLEFYRAPGSITPLASKIECQLDTGRTHQIRVHMAHNKTPLIGDATYGNSTQTHLNRFKSAGVRLPESTLIALGNFNRQALHARQLILLHPKNNEQMQFVAPIPEDLVTLENALAALTKSDS